MQDNNVRFWQNIVCGGGFLRYVLDKYGYSFETGIILIVNDMRHAKQLLCNITKIDNAVKVEHLKYSENVFANYQTLFHLYQQNDREENVVNFLENDAFLSILIVGGIVPSYLQEGYCIFRIKPKDEDSDGCEEEFNCFQKFVINNLAYVARELELFKSSKIMQKDVVPVEYKVAFQAFAATAKIWELYLRDVGMSETEGETYFVNCMEWVIEALNTQWRYEGTYLIGDALRNVVVEYILEHDEVQVLDLNQPMERGDELSEIIYFDSEFYYFEEELLKKICKPFTDTVSFLQLKQEMWKEGILFCNNVGQKNYTVKKMIYEAGGMKRRVRFIKLFKASLEMENGLALENLQGVYGEERNE